MTRDPQAEDRLRAELAGAGLTGADGLSERPMFGGLCLMRHGHMLAGVREGRLMLREFERYYTDRTVPERAACGLGLARRRTQRPPSAIAASGGRGCLPLLDGRTRQRPVIHRTHPYGGDCRGIRRLQGIPSTP